MRLIGIDVGGSAVKLGAISEAGEILEERSLAVPPDVRLGPLLDQVSKAALELAEGSPARGLGLALPGLLDRAAGRVQRSPNLPWLEGAPVRAELAARAGLEIERVRLENDANAAALGELRAGGARAVGDALFLTLGTGIGGGLILAGKLYVGRGQAGEIGHVCVDPQGRACGCGARGCLETLASASAARRRAQEAGLPAAAPGDLTRLAAAARAGDGPERALLESVGRDLGHGLAQVVCLLDVRSFVFGGGFSAALDVLEPGIRQGLEEWAYGERVTGVHLAPAELGASAGWIGAAFLTASETT